MGLLVPHYLLDRSNQKKPRRRSCHCDCGDDRESPVEVSMAPLPNMTVHVRLPASLSFVSTVAFRRNTNGCTTETTALRSQILRRPI